MRIIEQLVYHLMAITLCREMLEGQYSVFLTHEVKKH